MYTVIGATKTRTFRVLWALEELGLDYEHISCAPRSEQALSTILWAKYLPLLMQIPL